jgi:2-polyprenyl-6-methoxyphenol hydroxylase-like FAD-dependent oxidoreductase
VKYHLVANDGSHALVLGAGIAGLLAARVLVDHFSRVTLIDRDDLPENPETRNGVPQAHHAHILFVRGQRILENLFPGMIAELTSAGAPTVEWTADCPILFRDGWTPRFHSNLITRTCSRHLLEWQIRQRLMEYGNSQLTILSNRQMLGLDANKTRVTGVKIRHERAEEIIQADLVVDATGRESHMADWLPEIGYPAVEEKSVNAFLGYASRIYRQPHNQPDWKALFLMSNPGTRGGLIYPIEDHRWVVTLSGRQRDYPPTNEDEFIEFARSLRSPAFYEAIKDVEPLTPIHGYRRTENRLRHFERLSHWPEGLIVTGDAVCAYNPVYGQGMTSAGLAALVLHECLDDQRKHHQNGDLTGLGRRFQKRLAKSNSAPWLMSTAEDYRWPDTEGDPPDHTTRFVQWYTDKVMAAAVHNPDIFQAFFEVTNLVKSPLVLFKPHILVRALTQNHKSTQVEISTPPIFWHKRETLEIAQIK